MTDGSRYASPRQVHPPGRTAPKCVLRARPAYRSGMDHDSLDDLPPESRREVVSEVRAALGVDADAAEDLVRSAEPLWDAMERAGGLVDSWGGGEFCALFPGYWRSSALVHLAGETALTCR